MLCFSLRRIAIISILFTPLLVAGMIYMGYNPWSFFQEYIGMSEEKYPVEGQYVWGSNTSYYSNSYKDWISFDDAVEYVFPHKPSTMQTKTAKLFSYAYGITNGNLELDYFCINSIGDINCIYYEGDVLITSSTEIALYKSARFVLSERDMSALKDAIDEAGYYGLDSKYEAAGVVDGLQIYIKVGTSLSTKTIYMDNLFPLNIEPILKAQEAILSGLDFTSITEKITQEEALLNCPFPF